ncbi:MAG: hypothetical protein JRN20_04150 [Nitrososphaerota archaeon]|jgi:heme-degrading monooxygenase HmoA|nr:hypothetical protein [Nitrososphaerota archaeon]MDG6923691.1 hypothetical protein [Nitrososphaerota archaeon]
MSKTFVVEFNVKRKKRNAFEKELVRGLRELEKSPPEGSIAVLDLKDPEKQGRYLHIVVWETKKQWKSFMNSGRTARLGQFTSSEPKRKWYDTVVRVQDGMVRYD